MANENLEDWAGSAAVEHETIRAVVQAYAEGKIELDLPKNMGAVRNAPSFIPQEPGLLWTPSRNRKNTKVRPRDRTFVSMDKPYNAKTLADFLGWVHLPRTNPKTKERTGHIDPSRRVFDGLTALQYIEEGFLAEDAFDGPGACIMSFSRLRRIEKAAVSTSYHER